MLKFHPFLFLLLGAIPIFGQGAEEYEIWKKGRAFWYQNNWEKAAEVYQEHISQFPNSPRRCKSKIYLGYCYYELNRKQESFEIFTEVLTEPSCKPENLVDAKSKRYQIAYQLATSDPKMKRILTEGLSDPNPDIRLAVAVWLSELNDPSGIEVFFYVLKNEQDQDRRDTAAKHILKIGSADDKRRLEKTMEDFRRSQSDRKPKMVRLIIRDLANNEEKVKMNLPIKLINIILSSFTDEQRNLIEKETGIDLDSFNIDLEDLPTGHVLFKVIDSSKQEIKVYLE